MKLLYHYIENEKQRKHTPQKRRNESAKYGVINFKNFDQSTQTD